MQEAELRSEGWAQPTPGMRPLLFAMTCLMGIME